MYREELDIDKLKERLACLYAELYLGCATMSVATFEHLCRKINVIRFKINSFKGGRYGKKK